MSIINKKTKVKKTKGHERTQTAATETAISYEEAERIGLSDLRFSAEEVPLINSRLVSYLRLGRRGPRQVILWSIAHVREPVEYAHWTACFNWDEGLRDFRRDFASYTSVSARNEIEVKDMQIMLGALEQEERERRFGTDDGDDDLEDMPGHDLRVFDNFIDYCEESSPDHEPWTYLLTKETFRASQDPVHNVKKPGAWTHLRSLFGDRNHYDVDEYCLRIDLFLTKRARLTRMPSPVSIPKPQPPRHTRVMSAHAVHKLTGSSASTTLPTPTPVGSPVREKKESTNAGSSEGDEIIVTSSDSDGTSQGPLETHYAKERIEEESSSPKAPVRSSSTSASLKSRHEREGSTSEKKKEKRKKKKEAGKDRKK